LRKELDWIVMKAMEKDRNRRYDTASAFAADVLRYLHGEPVQASPLGAGYQLRKFVQKHKKPLALVIAFVVLLLSAVVVRNPNNAVCLLLGKANRSSTAASAWPRGTKSAERYAVPEFGVRTGL
jgi:hypothetical protein